MADNVIKDARPLSSENQTLISHLFSLAARAVIVKNFLELQDSKIQDGVFYIWLPEYQMFLVVDPTKKSLNYANKDLVISQENFSIDFGTLIMICEPLERLVIAAERIKEEANRRALEILKDIS